MSDSENRFYPYNKVYEGYIDLSKTTDMPKMIADDLLDMPRGNGYNPPDDNTYPRCRFWKYLYYDEEMPLEKSLPTPKQKKSVLFSTDSPTKAPTKKGYRIFPQIYIPQAQSEAQTRLYIYMGRTIADSDYKVQISIICDIWTNTNYESNTKSFDSYSRLFAMEQALIECLSGVNIRGTGTFYFNRSRHPDCGSMPIRNEENIGRRVVFGLEVTAEQPTGGIENNGVEIGNGLFMG